MRKAQWGRHPDTQMVPFDKGEHLMHYPEDYPPPYSTGLHWVPNYEFTETLRYVEYQRGRSAAYFVFRRHPRNTTVTFFMRDFQDLIPHLENGIITGMFTFCKTGQNYGCKLVKADK